MTQDYETRKNQARDRAIEVQEYMAQHSISWGEYMEIQDYLERLGKRFGLLTEFKENGLI